MKKVLVVVISLFALTLGVSADAEHGICAGKKVNGEGYCTLDDAVPISSAAFNPSMVNMTNGKPAAYYNYRGTINGKTENLYCIDSNLTSPSGSSYKYARALDPERYTLDGMLARMYVSLVNSAVYDYNNNSCSSLDACFSRYLQAANVLMRALVTKKKYNIQPKSSWGCVNLGHGEYQNIVNQLEGLPYTGTALKEAGHYSIIKKWYDTASGATGYTGQTFKIETRLDTSVEVVTETNGDNFTKTVPIKLSGLSNFTVDYNTWKKTNPRVQVVGLECSEGLTCEIDTAKSGFNLNDNLIEKFTNTDSVTFYVKVSGNSQTLKDNKKGTLTVKIDKYHVLDTDNLAILRGYSSQAQGLSEKLPGKNMNAVCYQRMVALMPTTPQKVELEVDLDLPSYCRVETDDSGNTSYKLGTRDVSVGEYIEGGCCKDINTSDLSESELEEFQEKCDGEDIVDLKQECGAGTCEENVGNLPGKNVDSYVRQMSMKSIMNKVKSWENSSYVDSSTYGEQTKNNLAFWRDDEFASELENNNYCKIYTSEENHMYYPTTTTATSGRYFVFAKGDDGEYLQPYVEGKIQSTFHTAYDLWRKDYINAIKTEKSAYTAWQYAENIKDALSHETTTSGSHSYVCGSHEENGKTVKDYCPCSYTIHHVLAEDTYYNGDYAGTTQAHYSASWVTDHSSCGRGDQKKPTYDKGAKSKYNATKNARKELERNKTECQKISKKYQSDWKYILEPDLTFHYNQKYYDSVSGQIKFITTDIDMEISDEAEKYFPNASTRVTEPTKTTGHEKLVVFNQADNQEREGAIYGGSNSVGERVNEPFENVDITDNEDHNYTKDYEGIKLYYKPDKAYYSLVPSGLIKTSEERTSSESYLELGYVFNVQITNYQGEYETWFTIGKNGHLEIEPSRSTKNDSNIQVRINDYLEANKSKFTDTSNNIDTSNFSSKCIYCNREVIYERPCITCEDDPFKPNYIYRSVNPSNLDPNGRKSSGDLGNNWSDKKGEAAERRINELAKQDAIYNDYSKENLEYEFNLSTKTMQEIKTANKSTNYYDFDLSCNDYGKECVSDFVNRYASYTEGRNKYKYYIASSDEFKVGTMNNILGGSYPDLEDCPNKLCP